MKIFLSGTLLKQLPVKPTQLKKVFQLTLKKLKFHQKLLALGKRNLNVSELNLNLCTDAEIRLLNKKYRKLNKATDVLSFPSSELPKGPWTEIYGLGDLVISLETTQRAALRNGRAHCEEFAEVFIHGVLHLLGFDHVLSKKVRSVDAAEMRFCQTELFLELKKAKFFSRGIKKRRTAQK